MRREEGGTPSLTGPAQTAVFSRGGGGPLERPLVTPEYEDRLDHTARTEQNRTGKQTDGRADGRGDSSSDEHHAESNGGS